MINLPRDQLPAPLRRKLVFGDPEQLAALRDLEIQMNKCQIHTLNINPTVTPDNVRPQIPARTLAKLKTVTALLNMATDELPVNLQGLGPLLGDITRELSEVSV